jgi:hypothetical protein
MTRENVLQKKCMAKAKQKNVLAYKVMSPGHRGFPDVLLVFDGEKDVEYVRMDKIKAILENENE